MLTVRRIIFIVSGMSLPSVFKYKNSELIMLYCVFDLQDVTQQDNESLDLARYIMKDLPTIFITHCASEDEIADIMHRYNFDVTVSGIRRYKSLDNFLCANMSNTNEWFLIFVTDASKLMNYGGQFVFCPYKFWSSIEQFETKSFTEHAKKKLLYNELSWLYMDSIVNDTDLEVKFLKSVFNQFDVKNVLDCCCGIGRHACICKITNTF